MDEKAKKNALRMIPYGIYLIGTCQGEAQDVFIGSWLMQCSFKPPLVVTAVHRDNHVYPMIQSSGVFSVSIFGADQKALASKFLGKRSFEDQTVNGVPYRTDQTGSPILVDAPAYIECKVVDIVEKGDHHLFLAEVINAYAPEAPDTLTTVNSGWKYGG